MGSSQAMAEYVVDHVIYRPGVLVGRIVNTIIGIIETMLALRLILELLGANSSSQFVAWVYSVTDGLVGPFAGAFPAWVIDGYVLDISTIFAMIGYAILGWIVVQLLSFIFSL